MEDVSQRGPQTVGTPLFRLGLKKRHWDFKNYKFGQMRAGLGGDVAVQRRAALKRPPFDPLKYSLAKFNSTS